MVERLEATLATIGSLERFRGHLYNWYDTRDLRRLEPAYVSSVDSGNLAGHLLALSNACRQMIDQPLPVAAALAGIGDALALAREAAGAIGDDRRSQTLTRRHLDEALDAARRGRRRRPRHARGLGGPPGRARRARPDAVRRRGGPHRRARRGRGQRARDLGRGGPAGREQPRPRPRAAPAARRRLTALPDDRRAVRSAGPATPATGRRPRRRSSGGSRRSPTRPSSSSGRWTSASCSTRPASSSRSGSGSGTARWTRATTTSSPPRPASPASSRSPRATSPPDHWFRLGRALTPVGRGSALISWSGSMFEYLMPALVMRAPARSLLDHTYRLVVARQMRYAAERGVPWGISESGFNARDLDADLPVLGLRRARPRPEARPERGRRRRPVRDRASRR